MIAKNSGYRSRRHARCSGVVAVEMAVTLPLLFLIVFTSIEFGRMNIIRHTASNAAYEAARRAIVPGATAADADDVAHRIMAIVGARSVQVRVTPAVIELDTSEVTVEVTVPTDANGFLACKFFRGKSFRGVARLRRENF